MLSQRVLFRNWFCRNTNSKLLTNHRINLLIENIKPQQSTEMNIKFQPLLKLLNRTRAQNYFVINAKRREFFDKCSQFGQWFNRWIWWTRSDIFVGTFYSDKNVILNFNLHKFVEFTDDCQKLINEKNFFLNRWRAVEELFSRYSFHLTEEMKCSGIS